MMRGAVWADVERYGALRLGAESRGILRGEVEVRLREDVAETRTARRRPAAVEVPEQDRALWERLRACRKRLADAQGVPPYVIFHDRTLREMLDVRPRSAAELLGVNGVGQAKLDRYGEAFLEELASA